MASIQKGGRLENMSNLGMLRAEPGSEGQDSPTVSSPIHSFLYFKTQKNSCSTVDEQSADAERMVGCFENCRLSVCSANPQKLTGEA
jgi:hypothetical protein